MGAVCRMWVVFVTCGALSYVDEICQICGAVFFILSHCHIEVKVLDGRGDLEEVQLGLGLVQLRPLNNLVEQLPALSQLQHDEQEVGRVDHILQVDNTRVVDRLKDPDLVQHV